MKQQYEFPRVITRGYYDLHTGKKLKKGYGYSLFPKKKFDRIFDAEEIVIFVHGMRNTRYGAKKGGQTLRRRLRQLGFKNHPVVSFSYDADIRGAHKYDDYDRVISLAELIAERNGEHLLSFVYDYVKYQLQAHGKVAKVHLVGHSLGCEVITSFLDKSNIIVESVHLLGSPVNVDDVTYLARERPIRRLVNYINKKDDVIKNEAVVGRCKNPSCLEKAGGRVVNKYCPADNHGFKAYSEKLRRFP